MKCHEATANKTDILAAHRLTMGTYEEIIANHEFAGVAPPGCLPFFAPAISPGMTRREPGQEKSRKSHSVMKCHEATANKTDILAAHRLTMGTYEEIIANHEFALFIILLPVSCSFNVSISS